MSGGSRVTALLKFLDSSPSPFHAVDECRKLLEAAGFLRLHEASSAWGLQTNGKYFFTRNGSSIVAFTIGGQSPINPTQLGVKIIAAHTDSPCLRMKPLSKRKAKDGFLQVAVETYGGGLWHTWFDRDLSVAGRIVTNSNSAENGGIKERLVNIVKPVMRIPTLAIHLDRSISTEGFKFNTELQLLPILATEHKEHDPNDGTSSCPMMHGCLYRAICESVKVAEHEEITGIDLCLYDVQNATLGGVHGEFVQSARLDNLFMSFAGLSSLLESSKDLEKSPNINMLVLFDNEEVGSLSAAGAESTLIHATIQRIFRSLRGAEFDLSTILARSFLISADMAHATHPNYPEKHDECHRPQMHKGLVIKYNSNQRYATNSRSTAIIKALAKRQNIPLQEFMVRNDSPCGTTIGPIVSAQLGLPTIDMGVAQLSMHSIREMAGVEDLDNSIRLFTIFYSEDSLPNVHSLDQP